MNLDHWTLSPLRTLLKLSRRRRQSGPRSAEVDALIGMAHRFREQREFSRAAFAFGELVDLLPTRTEFRVQYGNMLKDAGRLAEAESVYRAAIAQAPDDSDIHLQLGHALKLRGELEAAEHAYRQALALDPSNANAAREVSLMNPRASLTVHPQDISELADIVAKADRLRDEGRFLFAALAYRQALEMEPDRSDLRVQLGNMLKDSGHFDEALREFSLAAKARPADADVWLQYGRAFYLSGRTAQAISSYNTALRLQPSLHEAAGELDRILPIDQSRGSQLRSKLELRGSFEVCGWVVDPVHPEQPVEINVCLDGTPYLTIRAELPCSDLINIAPRATGGGFAITLPPGEGAVEVSISARGEQLRGSPFQVTLQRSLVPLLPRYARAREIEGFDRDLCEQSASVAIIIPVFNAPQETERCLSALMANTTTSARLIILDDASTDLSIRPLLDAYRGIPGILVERSEVNLGYTRTVNRGISLAGISDVVILNSDTAVGPRWLEQLQCAALSAPDIASVTAVSDNAGAFTVPNADRPTSLPKNFLMEDLQRLAAQIAGRHWPVVPTGNGFCMYIRRAALDATGVFDEDDFPRGYGEENDWCMRALRRGWRHLIDDRTLVHHERSASFGEERASLVKAGQEVLAKRYPEYRTLVREMSVNPGLADARRRMRAALATSPRKPRPRILFVISTRTGGTPQTNRDLMAALSDEYEPILLTCDAQLLTISRPDLTNDGRDIEVARFILSTPLTLASHTSAEYDATLMRWLNDFSVELLHIRHLAWHSLNLPAVAQSLGIPVVFSFHDFYAACPTVKLLDGDGTYCGGACTSSDVDCTPELWKAAEVPPFKNRFIHEWRARFKRVHDSCDAFVTTSESTRATLLRIYPELSRRPFDIIPHGRDFEAFATPTPKPGSLNQLKILVPGNISLAKGRDIIAALAEIDRGKRLHFHIIGEVSPPIPGPVVSWHGRYARNDFVKTASWIGADVGAVFSIWPETHCHTLTELWAAGLPVVGFDLGAVGERIRKTGGGWVISHDDVGQLHAALTKLADDATERQRASDCVNAWQDGEGRTQICSQMASHYREIYSGLLSNRRVFRLGGVAC